jgi:hypothetical protein
VCAEVEPPLRKLADGHFAACHFPVSRDAPAPTGPRARQADVADASGGRA